MIYTKQGPVNALQWNMLLLSVVRLALNRIFFTSVSFFQNPENKFNKLCFRMLRIQFSKILNFQENY